MNMDYVHIHDFLYIGSTLNILTKSLYKLQENVEEKSNKNLV